MNKAVRLRSQPNRITSQLPRLVEAPAANSYWDVKANSHQRGYTRAWEAARIGYLAKHPICVLCEAEVPARTTAATVVDHKIPHKGDKVLFWDSNNWQALCKPCHDTHKRQQERDLGYY